MRSVKEIKTRIAELEKYMKDYSAHFIPIFGQQNVYDNLLTKRLLIAELKWTLQKKGSQCYENN
jgi:hypothetical protein